MVLAADIAGPIYGKAFLKNLPAFYTKPYFYYWLKPFILGFLLRIYYFYYYYYYYYFYYLDLRGII